MDKSSRQFWILNLSFLIIRLIAASIISITPDEAYYWTWSNNLDWSYFDHPPMVAYWIAITTFLFGNSELAIRISSPVAFFVISWLIFRIGRKQSSPQAAIKLVFALNIIPFVNLGSIVITPDTPLLLFWVLGIFLTTRLLEKEKLSDWLLLGIAIGLGLLSKYTMFLFLPVIYWIFTKQSIPQYKYGKWISLSISMLLFLPVIIWNASNGFISFSFQFSHISGSKFPWYESFFGFWTAQFLLFTPGFWYLFIKKTRQRESFDKIGNAMFFFTLLPLFVVFPISIISHAEAGWAAIAYPSALYLAWKLGVTGTTSTSRWKNSILISAFLTILLYSWGFGILGNNPNTKQADALENEAAKVLNMLEEQHSGLPIVTQHYRIAALWQYKLAGKKDKTGVLPLEHQRQSQYDIWPKTDIKDGFIWVSEARTEELPEIPDNLDCIYADEKWPDKITSKEFAFLICTN